MRRTVRWVPWAAVILCGAVYVGNAWSPSSYALALRLFGAENDGLVIGRPRDIRSDEWAVITPLTQATVNNGFRRFNATSLYQEDLRSVYAMPIFDWGLAFKPTMWLYPLVPPAFAYSFHHFALMALFVVGYTLLLRRLSFPPLNAFSMAAICFASGFTQYW